ncbi:WD40-repeat-containing domain protein [Gorgonomyces haynaldii]|nr:WD40-repeat-containing domain protein [Gorgonomyces haynaldii]
MDRVVLSYLHKRGYAKAEQIFRQETRIQDPVGDYDYSNLVEFYAESKEYASSYVKLQKWIQDSIDVYQLELRRVLFPLFVHCYLDLVQRNYRQDAIDFYQRFKEEHTVENKQQVQRLEGVINDFVQENELVQNFRQNKYGVKMSRYSFELLLSFLQDNKYMLLLRLMNQYVLIETAQEKPGMEEGTGTGLIGEQTPLDEFNQQQIKLGPLPPDLQYLVELERFLDADPIEDGPEIKQLIEKEKEMDVDAPSRENVPLPPKKFSDFKQDIEMKRHELKRQPLSTTSLPSICCYTFMNTNDAVTSLRASENGEAVACAMADSLVKLWTIKGRPGQPLEESPSKTLIGHSGPVYGMDFTVDNQFLLTSSQDKTVRLWSMESKTNLVCYRGHNYPVFDVQWARQGYYFATASYDKTSRLYSTDHIFPLRLFVGHLSDVSCVKFHPNCNYLATGSSDHTCRLWDVQSGKSVRIFAKHNGPVTAIAMSPDGRQMASAGTDNTVKLWDLGSGRVIKTLTGHQSTINSLCFSFSGNILASGASDDSEKRARTQGIEFKSREIKSFMTKRTPIYNVQFTSRNVLLAMGTFEK